MHRGERALDVGFRMWTGVVFVFLFLPIAFVVAHSFTGARSFFVWGGFSVSPYLGMVRNPQLLDTVANSLMAAIGATAIAIVVGTLAGIALARHRGRWAMWCMGAVVLILTTPEIVDAIGLQIGFVWIGGPFRSGMVPLWIGQSVFSSAVVTMVIRARMYSLDETLEQAAADLYATPFRVFRQITLPQLGPAILAGGLLAFTFSLDNVVVAQFVSSANTTTFPVYMFGLTRTVMRPEVGAMSTVLLVFTLFALVVVALVLRRSGGGHTAMAQTIVGQ